MVRAPGPQDPGAEDIYDRMQERWPGERPSRKRRKQADQRSRQKRIVVRAVRRDSPDAARISRALLAAQRELAQLQAEADARRDTSADGEVQP